MLSEEERARLGQFRVPPPPYHTPHFSMRNPQCHTLPWQQQVRPTCPVAAPELLAEARPARRQQLFPQQTSAAPEWTRAREHLFQEPRPPANVAWSWRPEVGGSWHQTVQARPDCGIFAQPLGAAPAPRQQPLVPLGIGTCGYGQPAPPQQLRPQQEQTSGRGEAVHCGDPSLSTYGVRHRLQQQKSGGPANENSIGFLRKVKLCLQMLEEGRLPNGSSVHTGSEVWQRNGGECGGDVLFQQAGQQPSQHQDLRESACSQNPAQRLLWQAYTREKAPGGGIWKMRLCLLELIKQCTVSDLRQSWKWFLQQPNRMEIARKIIDLLHMLRLQDGGDDIRSADRVEEQILFLFLLQRVMRKAVLSTSGPVSGLQLSEQSLRGDLAGDDLVNGRLGNPSPYGAGERGVGCHSSRVPLWQQHTVTVGDSLKHDGGANMSDLFHCPTARQWHRPVGRDGAETLCDEHDGVDHRGEKQLPLHPEQHSVKDPLDHSPDSWTALPLLQHREMPKLVRSYSCSSAAIDQHVTDAPGRNGRSQPQLLAHSRSENNGHNLSTNAVSQSGVGLQSPSSSSLHCTVSSPSRNTSSQPRHRPELSIPKLYRRSASVPGENPMTFVSSVNFGSPDLSCADLGKTVSPGTDGTSSDSGIHSSSGDSTTSSGCWRWMQQTESPRSSSVESRASGRQDLLPSPTASSEDREQKPQLSSLRSSWDVIDLTLSSLSEEHLPSEPSSSKDEQRHVSGAAVSGREKGLDQRHHGASVGERTPDARHSSQAASETSSSWTRSAPILAKLLHNDSSRWRSVGLKTAGSHLGEEQSGIAHGMDVCCPPASHVCCPPATNAHSLESRSGSKGSAPSPRSMQPDAAAAWDASATVEPAAQGSKTPLGATQDRRRPSPPRGIPNRRDAIIRDADLGRNLPSNHSSSETGDVGRSPTGNGRGAGNIVRIQSLINDCVEQVFSTCHKIPDPGHRTSEKTLSRKGSSSSKTLTGEVQTNSVKVPSVEGNFSKSVRDFSPSLSGRPSPAGLDVGTGRGSGASECSTPSLPGTPASGSMSSAGCGGRVQTDGTPDRTAEELPDQNSGPSAVSVKDRSESDAAAALPSSHSLHFSHAPVDSSFDCDARGISAMQTDADNSREASEDELPVPPATPRMRAYEFPVPPTVPRMDTVSPVSTGMGADDFTVPSTSTGVDADFTVPSATSRMDVGYFDIPPATPSMDADDFDVPPATPCMGAEEFIDRILLNGCLQDGLPQTRDMHGESSELFSPRPCGGSQPATGVVKNENFIAGNDSDHGTDDMSDGDAQAPEVEPLSGDDEALGLQIVSVFSLAVRNKKTNASGTLENRGREDTDKSCGQNGFSSVCTSSGSQGVCADKRIDADDNTELNSTGAQTPSKGIKQCRSFQQNPGEGESVATVESQSSETLGSSCDASPATPEAADIQKGEKSADTTQEVRREPSSEQNSEGYVQYLFSWMKECCDATGQQIGKAADVGSGAGADSESGPACGTSAMCSETSTGLADNQKRAATSLSEKTTSDSLSGSQRNADQNVDESCKKVLYICGVCNKKYTHLPFFRLHLIGHDIMAGRDAHKSSVPCRDVDAKTAGAAEDAHFSRGCSDGEESSVEEDAWSNFVTIDESEVYTSSAERLGDESRSGEDDLVANSREEECSKHMAAGRGDQAVSIDKENNSSAPISVVGESPDSTTPTNCRFCGKIYKGKNIFSHMARCQKRDKKAVLPNTNHICYICSVPQGFPYLSTLRKHIWRIHKKSFTCDRCSSTFDHTVFLNDHLKTCWGKEMVAHLPGEGITSKTVPHSGETAPQESDFLPSPPSTECQMEVSENPSNGDMMTSPGALQEEGRVSSNVMTEMALPDNFLLEESNQTAPTNQDGNEPLDVVPGSEQGAMDDGSYKCEKCDDTFQGHSLLTEHVKLHHSPNPESQADQISETGESPDHGKKQSRQEEDLNTKSNDAKGDEGKMHSSLGCGSSVDFRCSLCRSQFLSSTARGDHLKLVCCQLLRYRCSLCPGKVHCLISMRNHLQTTHAGEAVSQTAQDLCSKRGSSHPPFTGESTLKNKDLASSRSSSDQHINSEPGSAQSGALLEKRGELTGESWRAGGGERSAKECASRIERAMAAYLSCKQGPSATSASPRSANPCTDCTSSQTPSVHVSETSDLDGDALDLLPEADDAASILNGMKTWDGNGADRSSRQDRIVQCHLCLESFHERKQLQQHLEQKHLILFLFCRGMDQLCRLPIDYTDKLLDVLFWESTENEPVGNRRKRKLSSHHGSDDNRETLASPEVNTEENLPMPKHRRLVEEKEQGARDLHRDASPAPESLLSAQVITPESEGSSGVKSGAVSVHGCSLPSPAKHSYDDDGTDGLFSHQESTEHAGIEKETLEKSVSEDLPEPSQSLHVDLAHQICEGEEKVRENSSVNECETHTPRETEEGGNDTSELRRGSVGSVEVHGQACKDVAPEVTSSSHAPGCIECSLCSQSFASRRELRKHLPVHIAEEDSE